MSRAWVRAEYNQRPRKTAWGPRRRVGQDEPWEHRKTEARILQRVRWVDRLHGAQGKKTGIVVPGLWDLASGKRMGVGGPTFLMLVMESRALYRQVQVLALSINLALAFFGGRGGFSPSSPT